MTADWRSPESYAYMTNLMPREVAWEFLRRNPIYRAEYEKSRRLEGDEADKFAHRWGLRFGVDPEIIAGEASLFWLHAECASVIMLANTTAATASSAFSLSRLSGFFKCHKAVDGVHILIKDKGYKFQIYVSSIGDWRENLHLNIPLNGYEQLRCEVTGRFCRFYNGDKPLRIRRSGGVYERLRDSLRVLDGSLAGATYREITEVLLGSRRMKDEVWKTSSARGVTIRLMRQANGLMTGGYASLLNS